MELPARTILRWLQRHLNEAEEQFHQALALDPNLPGAREGPAQLRKRLDEKSQQK